MTVTSSSKIILQKIKHQSTNLDRNIMERREENFLLSGGKNTDLLFIGVKVTDPSLPTTVPNLHCCSALSLPCSISVVPPTQRAGWALGGLDWLLPKNALALMPRLSPSIYCPYPDNRRLPKKLCCKPRLLSLSIILRNRAFSSRGYFCFPLTSLSLLLFECDWSKICQSEKPPSLFRKTS